VLGRRWQPGEEGLSTWVVEHDEAVLVQDMTVDSRVGILPDLGPHEGSAIAVPLRGREGVRGALTVERLGTLDRFSEEEFALVKLFAGQVSIALQNAEAHHAVEIRAETDALTQLRNKGTFDRYLLQAVLRAEPFGLLMVDLDEFKGYNDARGHQAGDELLRRIASALRRSVRESDGLFRYGGDEFTLVLPGTDVDGARSVAEKARGAIRAVSAASGWHMSCSIGIATFPADGAHRDDILLAADRACYASKRAGRDRISTAADGLALAGEFGLTTPTPVDQPVVLPS
jgi:diguanylate cyclase (GGDEF)-like protein